jgi:hypothetical protein
MNRAIHETMQSILTVVLLLGVHDGAPARPGLASPPACGDSVQFSGIRARNVMTASRNPRIPANVRGLGDVDPAQLRLLTDVHDAAVCRALRTVVMKDRAPDRLTGRPLAMTAYQAGAYYIVVLTPNRPRAEPAAGSRPRVVIGEHGDGRVLVFDARLNQLVETRA